MTCGARGMVAGFVQVSLRTWVPVRWWLRHMPLCMQCTQLRIILRTNELKNELLAAA